MNSPSRLELAVRNGHISLHFTHSQSPVIVRMDREEAEEALRIRGSKPDDFIVRETDKAGAK